MKRETRDHYDFNFWGEARGHEQGSLPIILPGRPSSPKNLGPPFIARAKFTSRLVRPSNPDMGFESLIWNMEADRATVKDSKPLAVKGGQEDGVICKRLPTIDTERFVLLARKGTLLKG